MKNSPIFIIRKVLPYVFQCCPGYYIAWGILSIFHGISWAASVLATQILFDTVTDLSTGESTYTYALLALAFIVCVLLIQQILNGICNYMSNILYMRMEGFLSRKVAEKSAKLDPIYFENADILDNINKASEGAKVAFSVSNVVCSIMFFYVPYFLFITWYLIQLKPILVWSILLAFVPKIISLLMKTPIYAKLEDKSAPIRREYNFYEEAITDRAYLQETRMLGAFQFFKEKYQETIGRLNKASWKADARVASFELAMSNLSLFSYFGILYLLFISLMTGDISVGAFAAVFSSIGMLMKLMEEVVCRHLGNLGDKLGIVRNFVHFLYLEERDGIEEKLNWSGEIVAEHVSFRYPNAKKDSIHDVSLVIKPGETIAIVGGNGAGKTTIVKMLSGLYVPTEGVVKIDGVDTKSVSLQALYNGISGVFQKYQRYQLTLKENIEISQVDGSHEIDEAVQKAGVDLNSRSFPDGSTTLLSREFDGVDLSGGQWQRVAIARGLYRVHDMIILDEPTAAIDPIEESKIYKKFAQLSKDKTATIITHRIGSAQIADRIIVMSEGRIIEEGTHPYLLERGGLYAEMYQLQAEWYAQ